MTRIAELLGGTAGGMAGRFSIELWPPRSDKSSAALDEALAQLVPLHPTFTSITYGAGGSTREKTHELVVRLHKDGSTVPMAHLTCAAHSRREVEQVLLRYREEGVENVLAVRGDPPLGAPGPLAEGELAHASDLVALAREIGAFCVAVAAHPEGHPDSPDRESDLRRQAAKIASADFAITQFFFRVEDYLSLTEELAARGVDKPVLPGIMPVTRVGSLVRMAAMNGSQLPAGLMARLESVPDRSEDLRRIGVEVATELGARLLSEGAPGLHFFTMNKATSTLEICENLGLGSSRVQGAR